MWKCSISGPLPDPLNQSPWPCACYTGLRDRDSCPAVPLTSLRIITLQTQMALSEPPAKGVPSPSYSLFLCFIFFRVLIPINAIIISGFAILCVSPLECKLSEGRAQLILSAMSSQPITVPGTQGGPNQTNTHLLGTCDGSGQGAWAHQEFMVGLG